MKPEITRPDNEKWQKLIEQSPSSVSFHLPGWLKTIEDTYGLKTIVCGVLSADGRLIAGIPAAVARGIFGRKRLVALSYSDYAFPLFADGIERENAREALYKAL